MTNYNFGNILLLEFPYAEGHGISKRPVLVLADIDKKDIVVAKITGVQERGHFDIPINNWKEVGLLFPSVIRTDKLATLSKSRIIRKFGTLDISYHSKIRAKLKSLFGIL
ncbi:type II toxin-antitoxin system PemK/MazF family toxin [bacterium]|nr:type II toxin-antitoxin system PemK/MazF family toxin [bacterium]MBU1614574.1 type II toxin-antitoxin system PemK/MazF family toxin [bacterium]